VIEALAGIGIEAIAFKGPVLAFRAYGDFGLGMFGNPRILIRDPDLARTMATLGGLGYEREKQLSATQLDLIYRLQGHETLLKKGFGIGSSSTRGWRRRIWHSTSTMPDCGAGHDARP
jgi:hypothetical protein